MKHNRDVKSVHKELSECSDEIPIIIGEIERELCQNIIKILNQKQLCSCKKVENLNHYGLKHKLGQTYSSYERITYFL